MRRHPLKTNLLIVGGAALWLFVVGAGSWALAAFSFAPGVSGTPGRSWPDASSLQRNLRGFTLVVALHPECPCSQATLEELDAIMAQGRGRLQARVLCVQYARLRQPVEDSAIWWRARGIAGVTVARDPGGAEARRFDARTSGEARLYGPDGRLLFHGGITAARGHVGDNPGQAAILDLALRDADPSTPLVAPVFGCSL